MSANIENPSKRRYRKRRRAEQEEETRQRITEATAELHGSVGPARTTVAAIAEKAGVQRATVYRHFPDDEALFNACSAHWLSENPLPRLDEWEAIKDPAERLRTALDQLYAWFDRNSYMVEKTTRDVTLVPALQPSMRAFAAWFQAATDVLLTGRRERGKRQRLVAAAIGHALDFETWRSLVERQGLSRADAVASMAALVENATAKPTSN